jgi:TPR repeat protein
LAPPSSGAASGEAELAATSGPEPKAAQRKEQRKDATVATAVPSAIGLAAMLVKRGQEFIANGDLGAARLVLRRAADGGDAQAALLLGSTYDPATFKHFKVIGLTPDPAQARAWYRRAVDLGSAEAVRRLEPLAQGAR